MLKFFLVNSVNSIFFLFSVEFWSPLSLYWSLHSSFFLNLERVFIVLGSNCSQIFSLNFFVIGVLIPRSEGMGKALQRSLLELILCARGWSQAKGAPGHAQRRVHQIVRSPWRTCPWAHASQVPHASLGCATQGAHGPRHARGPNMRPWPCTHQGTPCWTCVSLCKLGTYKQG